MLSWDVCSLSKQCLFGTAILEWVKCRGNAQQHRQVMFARLATPATNMDRWLEMEDEENISLCTFLTKTVALSSIPPSLLPVLACHWVYKKCPILLKELSIIKCFWLIYITRTTNQSCSVSEFVLIILDWNLAANNKIRHNDPLVAAVYIFQLGPSRCSSSK